MRFQQRPPYCPCTLSLLFHFRKSMIAIVTLKHTRKFKKLPITHFPKNHLGLAKKFNLSSKNVLFVLPFLNQSSLRKSGLCRGNSLWALIYLFAPQAVAPLTLSLFC